MNRLNFQNRIVLVSVLCLSALRVAPVAGQAPAAPQPESASTQPEEDKLSMADLEKLVAPIALYPDVLVAEVLAASTVPLQVVEAARFAEKNPGKTKAPPGEEWEPAVVGLLSTPDALKKINEDLTWLQQLGDAVIDQQPEIMEAVQNIRKRVNDAGALPSNDKQTVVVEKEVVKIVPADPQVVYVPTYNPSVVVVEDNSSDAIVGGFIGFGIGMAVGAACWGDCDWHGGGIWGGGDVDVDVDVGDVNIEGGDRNRETNVNREKNVDRSKTRNEWKPSSAARTEQQARRQTEARARNPAPGVKPSNVSPSQRQAQDRARNSPGGGNSARPSASPSSRDGAFGGSGSGSSARQESSRGQSSRSASPSSSSRSGGGASRSGGSRGGGGGSRGGGGRGGGRR